MSEMSGETTSVNPPRTRAGIWKQMDLPPPVGRTARGISAGQNRLNHPPLGRPEIGVAEVTLEERPRSSRR